MGTDIDDYVTYTKHINTGILTCIIISYMIDTINIFYIGLVYMASLQKKTVKGIDYWSLVESKRINGKPTPIVLEYFGNTKSFADKLMNDRIENKVLKSYSHGDTYALFKIAETLGIESILDKTFKRKNRDGIKRSKSLSVIPYQKFYPRIKHSI